MATIEENINRAIADFDAIAEVLKANGIDTTDLTTSDYAEHINETIQVGGTTITLEETEGGVAVIATNKNGETTTAVIKDGQNGFSPIITEDENNNDETYKLNIETKDGVITTPNLKGGGSEESFILDRTLTDPLKAAPADLVGKLYDMMSEGVTPDIPTNEIRVLDLVGEKTGIKYHGQADFLGFLSFVDINDNLSLCGITLSIKPPNGAVNSLTLFIYKNDTLVLEKTYVDLNITSESDVLFAFDPIQLTTGDVLGYGFTCHRPIGIYLSSIAPSTTSKYRLINTNTWTDFEPVISHERLYARFHSGVRDISGDVTSGGSVWSGKTGNFLGDSITNMGLYTERLSKKGNITVNNYGIGGTTYSDIYNVNQFYTRVNAMDDGCDFVFVFGGTNDWGLSAPLGTVRDTETDTFYGGLKATFSALRTKYPTKPIFVSTILQRNLASGLGGQVTGMTSNNHGNSIFEFNDAIKQVAGRYGCVVIDGCAESGIIYENLDTYTSDRLHLNSVGAERFAQFILDKINQVTPY